MAVAKAVVREAAQVAGMVEMAREEAARVVVVMVAEARVAAATVLAKVVRVA